MKSTLSTHSWPEESDLTVLAIANNTWAKFDQNSPQTRAKLNNSKPNVSGLNCLFGATSVDFE
jgi:hypothetical protein